MWTQWGQESICIGYKKDILAHLTEALLQGYRYRIKIVEISIPLCAGAARGNVSLKRRA